MKIKIENLSGRVLPKRTEQIINSIMATLPREHLRGIERLRFVDSIKDPRTRNLQKSIAPLPALYYPKQGNKQAWMEVALGVLLPNDGPIYKRILPRLSFKANMAAIIFSLIGQHHFLTLRHSIRRGQLEPFIRDYTEKQLKRWNEKEHGFRARIFKPIQPTLERWARSLQRRAKKGSRS
ncbi:MAG TPA: hypothetical protein VHU19_13590 [Pyrinomonadaceae bacterium]|jgi:hypothetical protein|nr:hypothetical protein [Pyrinomonadaceae bacterium]